MFHIRNRPANGFFDRGCKKGVDLALVRPAAYESHASDFSAVVDLGSEGRAYVGTVRKQGVEVGHRAVLPDEGMGPVEAGVPAASHDLAPVVVAEGYVPNISREEVLEDCDKCVVLPNRAELGTAIGTADLSNNLPQVVDAPGRAPMFLIGKLSGSVVFPRYGVKRSAAVSREANGLAMVVDPKCEPVRIAIHRRKSFGLAVVPQHGKFDPIIRCAGRA